MAEDDWPEPLIVAEIADAAQEWVIHDLFPHAPTNWPPCPHHPTTHPLRASRLGDVAVWLCPLEGVPVAAIGQLGPGLRAP
jgi:hypothetical protein